MSITLHVQITPPINDNNLSLSLSLSSFPLLSLSKSAAARGWDGQVGCRSVGGKAGATSVKWGKERHWGAGYVVQREETPPVGVVMLAFSFQELQSWGSVCQSFVATQTFEMRGAGPHITGSQSNTAPRRGRHAVFRRPAKKTLLCAGRRKGLWRTLLGL